MIEFTEPLWYNGCMVRSKEMKMTENELKAMWSEQNYERRANGMGSVSYANWKRQQAALAEFFNKIKEAK